MQFSFNALDVRVPWSDFLWFFHLSCVLLHSWIHYLSLSIYSLYLLDNVSSSTLMLFFTSVRDTTHGHHNVVGSRVFVQQTINIGQKIILMALQRQGNFEYQSFQTLYKEGITSISTNVCSSSQLHARTDRHTRTHAHTRTLLKKDLWGKTRHTLHSEGEWERDQANSASETEVKARLLVPACWHLSVLRRHYWVPHLQTMTFWSIVSHQTIFWKNLNIRYQANKEMTLHLQGNAAICAEDSPAVHIAVPGKLFQVRLQCHAFCRVYSALRRVHEWALPSPHSLLYLCKTNQGILPLLSSFVILAQNWAAHDFSVARIIFYDFYSAQRAWQDKVLRTHRNWDDWVILRFRLIPNCDPAKTGMHRCVTRATTYTRETRSQNVSPDAICISSKTHSQWNAHIPWTFITCGRRGLRSCRPSARTA